MSYSVQLTIEARHHLSRLDKPIQQFIIRQLGILRKFPTRLSFPAQFPYARHGQLYRQVCIYKQQAWEIVVRFQYSQDEKSLIILGIHFAQMPDDDNFPDDVHGYLDE